MPVAAAPQSQHPWPGSPPWTIRLPDPLGPDRDELEPLLGEPPTLEALLDYCELRQLAPGELLLSPGETNDTLYLLLEGRLNVNLERSTGDGDFVIEPGECVGEISIIDGRPATAFVAAAQPSVLMAVSAGNFWSKFITNPQIARNFMRLFAERFRARNQMMQRTPLRWQCATSIQPAWRP